MNILTHTDFNELYKFLNYVGVFMTGMQTFEGNNKGYFSEHVNYIKRDYTTVVGSHFRLLRRVTRSLKFSTALEGVFVMAMLNQDLRHCDKR